MQIKVRKCSAASPAISGEMHGGTPQLPAGLLPAKPFVRSLPPPSKTPTTQDLSITLPERPPGLRSATLYYHTSILQRVSKMCILQESVLAGRPFSVSKTSLAKALYLHQTHAGGSLPDGCELRPKFLPSDGSEVTGPPAFFAAPSLSRAVLYTATSE